MPAGDGHSHAQGRAVSGEDAAVGCIAAKLGERDPQGSRRITTELGGVRLSVGEIAEHDDATVDLRELRDERARHGDGAVEVRAAVALTDGIERAPGSA